MGQTGVSQIVPDLRVTYWLLGHKGRRRFETLNEAWELRYLANHEHVDILGFNKVGKLVVKAPGRDAMEDSAGPVTVELSRPAATFLRAAVEHMNQRKLLPPDDGEALQTSAWLEEIAAKTKEALDA